MGFVIPVVEDWLEQEIAQWITMKNQFDDPLPHEQMLYYRVHLAPKRGVLVKGSIVCL